MRWCRNRIETQIKSNPDIFQCANCNRTKLDLLCAQNIIIPLTVCLCFCQDSFQTPDDHVTSTLFTVRITSLHAAGLRVVSCLPRQTKVKYHEMLVRHSCDCRCCSANSAQMHCPRSAPFIEFSFICPSQLGIFKSLIHFLVILWVCVSPFGAVADFIRLICWYHTASRDLTVKRSRLGQLNDPRSKPHLMSLRISAQDAMTYLGSSWRMKYWNPQQKIWWQRLLPPTTSSGSRHVQLAKLLPLSSLRLWMGKNAIFGRTLLERFWQSILQA